MIRELIHKLGLDRIPEFLGDELRQVQLKALQEERALVQSLLDRIEARLAALTGKTARRTPTTRRAKTPGKGAPRFRKPGESLKEMAVKALEAAKKPLAVDDLLARVKKLGYKTAASAQNLRVSLFKVLGDTELFKRVQAGVYKLAGAKRTEAAKPATTKSKPASAKRAKRKQPAKPKVQMAAPKTAKKPAGPKLTKPAVEKKPATPKSTAQPAPQVAAETATPAQTEQK